MSAKQLEAEPRAVSPSGVDIAAAAPPTAVGISDAPGSVQRQWVRLREGKWRRRLVGSVAVLLGLLLYDTFLVEFMHVRRQDSVVSQFNAPATSSEIRFGDAVALLQIPKLGVNDVVIEGDSHANLRAGPAHRIGTALPGTSGNSVLFGKSRRYGAPFEHIANLQPGDELFVMRRATQPVRYVVDEVIELDSSDSSAFEPTDVGRVTLVTSRGWTSRGLVAVVAYADDSASLEPAVGVVAGLENDGVSGGDLGVVTLWAGALVALCFVLRRDQSRLPRTTRLVIFLPLIGIAALQFLMAAERLFPSTV